MTDFQRAILRMMRPFPSMRTIADLAAEHYNEVHANKGQRSAVARACNALHDDKKIVSFVDDHAPGRIYWWREQP